MPLPSLFLLSAVLAFLPRAHAQTTGTVTIASYTPYVAEHACGQLCVWIDSGHVGAAHDDIVMFLDCPFPYLNLCLCNSVYGTSVTSFLSSCASSRCSTASQDYIPEITTAVQVYNGYCAKAIGVTFPEVASTLAVSTTGGGSLTISGFGSATGSVPIETGSVAASTTDEARQTQTSAGNGTATASAASSSLELSESNKIALGVGLGMGLPSIALAVATYWSMRRRRHNAAAVE